MPGPLWREDQATTTLLPLIVRHGDGGCLRRHQARVIRALQRHRVRPPVLRATRAFSSEVQCQVSGDLPIRRAGAVVASHLDDLAGGTAVFGYANRH